MKFSQIIKEAMDKKRMNASGLAREMGYTPKHVLDLLAGKRRWNEETMDKACEILEIETEFKIKTIPLCI
jgi:plasmid maintenance system antidote protein VapI